MTHFKFLSQKYGNSYLFLTNLILFSQLYTIEAFPSISRHFKHHFIITKKYER